MKTSLSLLALVVTAACQYLNQSAPFRLMLESNNATLNGTVLGACHSGAASEVACYTGTPVTDDPFYGTVFYYNFNSAAEKNWTDVDTSGGLGYTWNTSMGLIPSIWGFSVDYTSNIAFATIGPGEIYYGTLTFDSCGYLYMRDSFDDTVNPPTYYDSVKKLDNWYLCLTTWNYMYEALAWKIGVTGEPQNPTCSKVRVKRVFTGA
jgi:hypothetical protein